MKFSIFEDNMPRLIKKMAVIEKKCTKHGCEFHFEELGEEFHEVKLEDGTIATLRFITVEAEGTAKANDWEFIATVQHMTPVNLISCYRTEYSVPERYYYSKPICEHCNTTRSRKDTYLVRNTITGEWKQVGKSCLKEFTRGLSAEAVAEYISWFEELVKGESNYFNPSRKYTNTLDAVMVAVEAVNKFGYKKTRDDEGGYNCDSTASTVSKVLYRINPGYDTLMDQGFTWETQENESKAKAILAWVRSLTPEVGSYLSNLKAACGDDYCESRNFGLIASSVAAYNREMEKQQREASRKQTEAKSGWVGSVGQRIELKDVSLKLITSWYTDFGPTYMYKMTDANGNIFTWKTGKWLGNDSCVPEGAKITIKGTIKEHSDYHGTKQTELTRCKVC